MVVLIPASAIFIFFKQKTAYEMRISDWSSDVCSSDLRPAWASTVSWSKKAMTRTRRWRRSRRLRCTTRKRTPSRRNCWPHRRAACGAGRRALHAFQVRDGHVDGEQFQHARHSVVDHLLDRGGAVVKRRQRRKKIGGAQV